MTRGGRVIAAAVLGLALVAATYWWFATFRRVERWVDLPPRGEAVYNPLYALKQALRAAGQPVESRQRLDLPHLALARRDTVLVFSDPRALAPHDLDALLAFAGRGGHLVLRMPGYDFRPGPRPVGALARRLPLQPLLAAPRCADMAPSGSAARVFCGSPRFRLATTATPLVVWGDAANGDVFARLPVGAGSVDLVSDLSFLDNGALRRPGHALLARQLLAPRYGQGTVHLVYAADMPPLWHLLLDDAWMALLPLLLATLGGLWMRSQRFGPLLPSPPATRRALIEHVQASGEHLLRYGRLTVMHRAVRDAVLLRLRRRDAVAAAVGGDAQAALLSARLGIPAREIAATLSTRPPVDAAEFRHRISQLIALRALL